jgi:hypothetical protein
MDTYEKELQEEKEQVTFSKHLVEMVANVIIKQLWMINGWGGGRPGESFLRDVQRRCDELSGWDESQR